LGDRENASNIKHKKIKSDAQYRLKKTFRKQKNKKSFTFAMKILIF